TFSPSLKRNIALARVIAPAAELGLRVEVEIRGKRVPATVVSLPFVPHRSRPKAAR
ncbi:MAG: glycine cleavage system protein T, partial [Chloroflexi bacterium]|nr:glycine cleavage system protein T [Chloroflexota bacterium]